MKGLGVDLQHVFDGLIGLVVGMMSWFGKTLWVEVQDLKQRIADSEVHVERDFVRSDRFDEGMREIARKLDVVIDRLAEKADRK